MVGSLTLRMKKALDLPAGLMFINFLVTYKCNFRCLMCDTLNWFLKCSDKKKFLKQHVSVKKDL